MYIIIIIYYINVYIIYSVDANFGSKQPTELYIYLLPEFIFKHRFDLL